MKNISQQNYEEAVFTVHELRNQVPENSPLLSLQHWCTLMDDSLFNIEDRQWCQSMGEALIDIYGISFEEESEEMSYPDEYGLNSDEEAQLEQIDNMRELAHRNGGDFDTTAWLVAQENEDMFDQYEYDLDSENEDMFDQYDDGLDSEEEYWRRRDQEDEEYWRQEEEERWAEQREYWDAQDDDFLNQGFYMGDEEEEEEVSHDKSEVKDIDGDDLCQ